MALSHFQYSDYLCGEVKKSLFSSGNYFVLTRLPNPYQEKKGIKSRWINLPGELIQQIIVKKDEVSNSLQNLQKGVTFKRHLSRWNVDQSKLFVKILIFVLKF